MFLIAIRELHRGFDELETKLIEFIRSWVLIQAVSHLIQNNQKHRDNQPQTVVKNTQHRASEPSKPKPSQRKVVTEPDKKKTFANQKKLLNEYYNWNVVFPSTTIHQNSILFRDAAQNESFRKKLQVMSEKIMTMGGRGHLGNDFGGSTKELSPRKQKSNTISEMKLAKSEISLNCIQNEQSKGGVSSSLLNLIGIPFNWKSRQLTSKSDNSRDKKKPNMLTNLFKKKRIMCNKR
jgi:hypothetical protein